MKKISYLFMLLFTVFIPKVYAFTYDVNVDVDNTSVAEGAVKDIKVSLKNIQGTSDGIAACSLNIVFDDNILLNDSVKSLSGWSLTTGKFYIFDIGTPVLDDSELFSMSVKVNAPGAVKITDIECSDGYTKVSIADKTVNFTTVVNNNNSNNNVGSNNNSNNQNNNLSTNKPDNEIISDVGNCNVYELQLTEGTIDFDPEITEYTIAITDFDSFNVVPVLESGTATYTVDKNIDGDNKNVVITVTAENGNSKTYTINVINEENNGLSDDGETKNSNYVPIFIGIICLLVLVNVFRIIKNRKK